MSDKKPHTSTAGQLPPEAKRTVRWLALALAVATVAAFAGVFNCDFVNFDDDHYVYRNRIVQGGFSWSFLRWALTAVDVFNWHPLTWLSLGVDYELFGLDPRGYHATNLALHVANSVFLLWLLARMTGSVPRSACVAAFFALHPLHVESVAWVAERRDVLSTFFWLATMAFYDRYCRQPGWWRYGAVFVTFALGLMAKPMLVTLPFVLLLLDYWPIRRWKPAGNSPSNGVEPSSAPTRSFAWLIAEKVPLFALSVASCAITYLAQEWGGAIRTDDEYALAGRLLNVPLNYLTYLRRLAWPANLAVMYPYSRELPPLWQPVAAGILLLAITLIALRSARRFPYGVVGWLWFLGTLVPVIGIVQVGRQATADRYMYVPMIGLLVSICWGVGDCAARRRGSRPLVAATVLLLLAGCAAATWLQVGYWRNGLTLFSRALRVAPRSPMVLNNLAVALADQGYPDEAEKYLRTCLRIAPNSHDAHLNLGLILVQRGRTEEAMIHLEEAIREKPGAVPLHDLGLLAQVRGDMEKAIDYYRQAVAAGSRNALAHQLLGMALMKQGGADEGRQHLDEARRLDPHLSETLTGGDFLH